MRLLIFLASAAICVTIFLARARVRTLPDPPPIVIPPATSTLTVTMAGGGKFEVDGQMLDLGQLEAVISKRKWDEHSALIFKETAQTRFSDGISAIDLARRYGVSRISMERLDPSSAAPTPPER